MRKVRGNGSRQVADSPRRRSPTGRSPIVIFEPHDVILPQIVAVLHFNDMQGFVPEVLKTMRRFHGNRRTLSYPEIHQFGIEANADKVGGTAAGVVGAAVAAHAAVSAIKRVSSPKPSQK